MTKNQHYIPQFYQKEWEYKNDEVWGLVKEENNRICLRSISRSCSQKYLYEPDTNAPTNLFENEYSKFETQIAPQYKALLYSINVTIRISFEQQRMISKFGFIMSNRHPYNLYSNSKNRFILSHFIIGLDDKEIEQKWLSNIYAQAPILLNDYSSFLFTNLVLYVTNKPRIFYCDCLIMNENSDEWLFPLSPFVLARYTKGQQEYPNRTVTALTEEIYDRFCRTYFLNSNTQIIYANNKEVLNDLLIEYSKPPL